MTKQIMVDDPTQGKVVSSGETFDAYNALDEKTIEADELAKTSEQIRGENEKLKQENAELKEQLKAANKEVNKKAKEQVEAFKAEYSAQVEAGKQELLEQLEATKAELEKSLAAQDDLSHKLAEANALLSEQAVGGESNAETDGSSEQGNPVPVPEQ